MKTTDKPICETDADGDKLWYLNGNFHRTDGPAVELADGHKAWYLNGKCHRTDGPAIEWPNGDKRWYLNGNFHRTDGPAIECSDGTKYWYLNDERVEMEDVFTDPKDQFWWRIKS